MNRFVQELYRDARLQRDQAGEMFGIPPNGFGDLPVAKPQALFEISLMPQHADGDHRNPQIGRALHRVTGQDTQAAAVNR